MAVFLLGDRKVEFHGSEWFIAENASVIGSVSQSWTEPGADRTSARTAYLLLAEMFTSPE